MRHLLRLQRLIAIMGFAAGIAQTLIAQEELPPEFLRAHALVVRFLASSFEAREQEGAKGHTQGAPGNQGVAGGMLGGPGGGSPLGPSAAQTPPPSTLSGSGPGPTSSSVQDRSASSKSPSTPDLTVPLWTTVARRYTVTGAPVAIRLSGSNILIVVQVTPYDRGKQGLQVVAQGQVWSRGPDGAIAYHSAFESLNVGFGQPVYFFPLGLNTDGTTALKVEISVDHFGDAPSIPDPPPQGQQAPGTKGR